MVGLKVVANSLVFCYRGYRRTDPTICPFPNSGRVKIAAKGGKNLRFSRNVVYIYDPSLDWNVNGEVRLYFFLC